MTPDELVEEFISALIKVNSEEAESLDIIEKQEKAILEEIDEIATR